MSIAGLVRELTEPPALTGAFAGALTQLDAAAVSSALTIRQPLAYLTVAHVELLQRNLRRHSVAELATSRTLEAVASTLKPTTLRDELLAHAGDELRHSKIFAALAKSLSEATSAEDAEDFDWILEHDEQFIQRYNGDVIAFVCDLFAGEVRTYSFVSAYIEALEKTQASYAGRIGKALLQVLADEQRHIGYTALHINQWMARDLDLQPYLRRCFQEFNRNSWIEVAETSKFFYERY